MTRLTNPVVLDQRRADMMLSLYDKSGRTCGTYTGLWDEFSRDVAANFRDTDYEALVRECIAALEEAEVYVSEQSARICVEVCRRALLGNRW